MQTTNNLLLETARSIANGEPEHGDSDLQVIDVISPVIELRSPCDQTFISTPTAVIENSFHVDAGLVVTAGSGAIDNLIANLSKGLWEINLFGSFNSNYQSATGSFDQRIVINWNTSINILGFKAGGALAAPIGQSAQRTVRILIPKTATLRAIANNTAAGENASSLFDIFCFKLL